MNLGGTTVGHYEILELIGRGGFGEVYRARDVILGRAVALKLLPAEFSQDRVRRERFKREAKAASKLNHPNLCAIYELGEFDGHMFMAMELIEGRTLRQTRAASALPAAMVIDIGEQIADGLAAAHRQGLIHRDIKSSNIILTADQRVKILDFGLAKQMPVSPAGPHETQLADLTTRGQVVGTTHYMAPEQLRGDRIDHRSDVFSFGVVLYELLTGSLPFEGSTIFDVAEAITRAKPKAFSHFCRAAPRLETIILRMLHKSPSRRYQDAQEVLTELRSLRATGMVTTPGDPKAMAIERRIHRQSNVADSQSAIGGSSSGNLLIPSQSFVGREQELADLFRLLHASDNRLITVVGPGGIGKSRLALDSAREQLEYFLDGVFYVALAPLESERQLIPAIAEAIGFKFFGPDDPKTQLIRFLQDKHLLLVLDNFEHLTEGAPVLLEILTRAALIKMIVTSRERLNLRDEIVYALGGLGYPSRADANDLEQFPAVQLFLERARHADPAFELSDAQKNHIVRLCTLVDGTPLALELAAAWIRLLSCEEIVAEVEQSIDFLATPLRDVSDRHRSLRAVFEHSWKHLRTDERSVFTKLSVFRGGFSKEAAQQVCGATLNILMVLADKSLVRREARGKLTVHELLRQFGHEKLKEDSEQYQHIRNAHSGFYLSFMRQQRNSLRGTDVVDALKRIKEEIDNLRTAWTWALEQPNLLALESALEEMVLYFQMQNHLEGYDFFNTAARRLDPLTSESNANRAVAVRLLGTAAMARGLFLLYLTRYDEAISSAEWALQLLTAESPMALGYSFCVIGQAEQSMGRYEDAAIHMERCLAEFAKLDDSYWLNHGRMTTAQLYAWLGNTTKARDLYLSGIAGAEKINDVWSKKVALMLLGELEMTQGSLESARAMFEESLEFVRNMNDLRATAACLAKLGQVAAAQQQYVQASDFFTDSARLAQEIGERRREAVSMRLLAEVQRQLGLYKSAVESLMCALRLATEAQLTPELLNIVLELAKSLYVSGEKTEAIQLLGVVLGHSACMQSTLTEAASLKAQSEKDQGMNWTELEIERGKGRDLDHLVQDILKPASRSSHWIARTANTQSST